MRIFVAIKIPKDIKDCISSVQESIGDDLAKIRWVNKDQMHLTLKFLGEVQPSNIIEIKKELKKIKIRSFTVNLDSIGVFPGENYIRVLWVGLEPEEDINSLQKDIDEKLKKLFKKDKDFKPHITLGRVKFVRDKEKFIENLRKIKIDNKKVDVNGFKLMKSTLSQKGPIYEEIASYTW